MKYSQIRKTKRYKTERAQDGAALTRSAFEFLLIVIVLILGTAIVIAVFFPVVSFSKKVDDRTQLYSVMTTRTDSFSVGDIVSVKSEHNISAGEILALEGEEIVMGTDRSTSVNCVQFEGKRYFDYEELKTKLRKPVVPKGYVLLNGDFTSSEELVVGELVPREYITGKVSTVLYPFSLFGRSADYLKK